MSINKFQLSKIDKVINQLWDASIITNDIAVCERGRIGRQPRDIEELSEMSKKLDEIIWRLRSLVARQ